MAEAASDGQQNMQLGPPTHLATLGSNPGMHIRLGLHPGMHTRRQGDLIQYWVSNSN